MLTKKLSAIVVLSLVFVLVAPVAAQWTYPKMDEIRFALIDNPDPHLAAMLAGEIEWMPDIIRVGDLNTLQSEGFSIWFTPGFHMCYFGINCRDVIPSTGTWRPPGTPLYPLNDTAFRHALAHLVPKYQVIPTLFGPIVRVLETFVAPSQAAFYNPDVEIHEYDPIEALSILTAAGYSNSTGVWMTPKGTELRKIYVMSPTAPTSIQLTAAAVTEWQNFFGTQYFEHLSGRTDISTRAFKARDFDIYFLCWGLGRYPDGLYAFFHSSQDLYGGNNSPGIINATLDFWLEQFYFNTTMEGAIESCFKVQEILSEQMPYIPLYSRNYIHATDRRVSAGVFERLKGIVPSPGYSAYNDYTFRLLEWENSAMPKWARISTGSLTYVTTLNPCLASWTYEWRILSRVEDGLTAVDPYTHETMPWIAVGYNYTFGTWPTLGIPEAGMKVTFWLRNDVYWHCGEPFTSEDVAFAWNYLKDNEVPEFSYMWEYLTYVETDGPYKVVCYLNTTSIFVWEDFAGTACLLPKHIWKDVTDFETFDPEEAHPSPPAQYPYLTKLCGIGPFIFKSWDKVANYIYVEANRGLPGKPYWGAKGPANPMVRIEDGRSQFHVEVLNLDNVSLTPTVKIYVDGTEIATETPTIRELYHVKLGPYDTGEMGAPLTKPHNITVTASVGGSTATYQVWLSVREDLNYDLKVDIKDVARVSKAFGTIPGHPYWDYRSDVNYDLKADIKDVAAVSKKFGWH